ncbi:MAG TPA: hypothetical protein VF100_01925 [Thermoanaerobaculia bacterium]
MTTTATTADGLSEQQGTYLRVLAILHYVHGALIALILLAMLVLFGFGVIGNRSELADPGLVAVMGLVSCGVLFVAAYAAFSFLVGRWLDQRRHWAGVIVFSTLNALNAPLGTLLGVFTIVVLAGERVRAAFEGERPVVAVPSPPPPPPG